jgi:UDP-2,3-diacylglucosamine pyrophosphatase LpxH
VNFIGAFEEALVREARESGVDGVICGHIHYPAMREDLGIAYRNCGDWVESCTALVEHHDGRFEIIRWTEPSARNWLNILAAEREPLVA